MNLVSTQVDRDLSRARRAHIVRRAVRVPLRPQRARPLREHIREYSESFKTKPRTKISIAVKKHGLRKLFKHSKRILRREPALSDFTPDLVRKEAIALANWLTREEKADLAGFGKRVDRFCEELDRRRERRILTDDELARLFQVARARGRILFYALAYYAGFRRGELGRATWADIDLEGSTACRLHCGRDPRGRCRWKVR